MLSSLWRRSRALSSAPLEYASTCFLPTTWLGLPLLSRTAVNHDTELYDFGLPDGRALELPVCGCLLLRAPGRGRAEGGGKDDFDGSDAVRPYTPISESSAAGSFTLLVKRYAGGAVSEYLHALPIGAEVDFKHIAFNVKEPYPFAGKSRFVMLCGGSGITPMFQALQRLLGTAGDERPVTLIYGNKSEEDILLRERLDEWARAHPTRLEVVHVLGSTPDAPPPAGWRDAPTHKAEVGWIDLELIRRRAGPAAADVGVFVCGVPAMYEELCGPRTEKGLAEGSVLSQLGYTSSNVVKM